MTIAAGIGLCTAVFGVLRATAFPPMPYDAPESPAVLGTTVDRPGSAP